MIFIDIVNISFRNLFRQKMRTTLTIISMMVGAFLIAFMLSVGDGLRQFMLSQVTLFANEQTISVRKNMDMGSSFGVSFGQGVQEYTEKAEESSDINGSDIGGAVGVDDTGQDSGSLSQTQEIISDAMLDAKDLEAIQAVDHVQEAAFETIVQPDYVRLSDEARKKLLVALYGVPQGYMEMLSFSSKDDTLLSEPDIVILSDGYAEAWGTTNADLLGKTILFKVSRTGTSGSAETKEFEVKVAGFFEKNIFAQVGFVTPTVSNEINAYVQNIEVEEYEKKEKAFEVVVLVDDAKNVKAVDKALEELDYDSSTIEEAIGQIGVVFDVISAALSSFGFVAMFVASIGIVNTLLMAIYERTREIGVMKAVGATRFTISFLFTAEALWLGLLGGTFGILMAFGVGRFANFILHNGIAIGDVQIITGYLASYPTFNVSVFSLATLIIVMSVTTGVAFLAGLYPSLRAGQLDPIVALRHD